MTPDPVALSEEEIAEIRRRAGMDRLTTWPGDVRRLLALLASRDQELANAKEAIEQLLGDDYAAAMWRNGNAALRAELESRDQRIRELGLYVQHNDKCRSLDYEVPCNCGLSSILKHG